MDKKAKIYVAGHRGMVGSAILRKLKSYGYKNVVTENRTALNLLSQFAVRSFYEEAKVEYVFVAAAKVGGINANNKLPADFIYENLQIQNNLIHFAHMSSVRKLIFLGSSCAYPKLANQPMREQSLLTGALEETNEPYAIAKIAGIKMCESYFRQHRSQFFSIMPTNSYGPNDNYDSGTSHVLPALIKKFHEGKNIDANEVTIWGTGRPLREFIYVDDIANAAIFVMGLNFAQIYEQGISHLNVGTGMEISIADLAKLVSEVVKYQGEIRYDTTLPDGTPRKLMDVSRIHKLGWKHETELEEGLEKAYSWYLDHIT